MEKIRLTIAKLMIVLVMWYALPTVIAVLDYHYGMSTLQCGWMACICTYMVYLFYGFMTITGGISIYRKYRAAREWANEVNARFANIDK